MADIEVFRTIVTNKSLKDAFAVVVFTRSEVFSEKIKDIPLNEFFADFNSKDDALEYIKSRFRTSYTESTHHASPLETIVVDLNQPDSVMQIESAIRRSIISRTVLE